MLNPLRLDDQTFVDIATRSRRLIQKYAADWTNENASDPGITILEMIAWLKDNLQFYMDQSHLISKASYLEMLGIKKKCAQPAEMIARFERSDFNDITKLPAGYPFSSGSLLFQLKNPITIQQACIHAVLTGTTDTTQHKMDLTKAFNNNALVRPFGQTPASGSCVYIGFDKPLEDIVSLYIDVNDEPETYRNAQETPIHFGEGAWELHTEQGKWIEATIIEDQTQCFFKDGVIQLKIDKHHIMTESKINQAKAYWLRFRLITADYDRAPAIKNLHLNTGVLSQKRTQVFHTNQFDILPELGALRVNHYVPDTNDISVELEIQTKSGYTAIDSTGYLLDRDDYGRLLIYFLTLDMPTDFSKLRCIMGYKKIPVYAVKGLPHEEIEIGWKNLLTNTVEVEVSEDYGDDQWRPWKIVDHFWQSAEDDRHLVYDDTQGRFYFGNNEKGMLPDSKENGLRIIQAELSGFDNGNGQHENLYSLGTIEGITAHALTSAKFGSKTETDDEAFRRFRYEFFKASRLGSKGQIESVIKQTPGLAIRDVSVMPAKTPGKQGRIIVLGKSALASNKQPILSQTYKTLLQQRVEDTRLLTENWIVSDPDYIGINVRMTLIKDPAVFIDKNMIEDLVKEFVEPTSGKLFGLHLSTGKLKRHIENLQGVIRITMLSLRTSQGSFKRADGDIVLPMSAISYLENCTIQILDDQGW